MSILPVNAVFSGLQTDGHYFGTPALIVQIIHEAEAAGAADHHDSVYPLPPWPLDPAHEISFDKLLTLRGDSPRFSYVGPQTLATLALSYRERHVVIIGRQLASHDIAAFATPLLDAGRTVQIETTTLTPSLFIDRAWVTQLMLPCRDAVTARPVETPKPNEVLACIRWRSDIDRVEAAYANRRVTVVWLQPSQNAEAGIYRQCMAVATRHPGWRVIRPSKIAA